MLAHTPRIMTSIKHLQQLCSLVYVRVYFPLQVDRWAGLASPAPPESSAHQEAVDVSSAVTLGLCQVLLIILPLSVPAR